MRGYTYFLKTVKISEVVSIGVQKQTIYIHDHKNASILNIIALGHETIYRFYISKSQKTYLICTKKIWLKPFYKKI